MGRKLSQFIEKGKVQIIRSDDLDCWQVSYEFIAVCRLKITQTTETMPRLDNPKHNRRITITKVDFYFYDTEKDEYIFVCAMEWRKPLSEVFGYIIAMLNDDTFFSKVKYEVVVMHYHPARSYSDQYNYEYQLDHLFRYCSGVKTEVQKLVLFTNFVKNQFSLLTK